RDAYQAGATYLDRDGDGYACEKQFNVYVLGDRPQPTTPTSLPSPKTTSITSLTIISVGDGDTVRVAVEGRPVTVRLACIDAPETAQEYGKDASIALKMLLPQGTKVTIDRKATDRYGRTVAELNAADKNVSLEMVRLGAAWVYEQYLDACPLTAAVLREAERNARTQKAGLWKMENPTPPWEFRRARRT
ncbi:MAG: thermonuclease family protein, partial [Gemmatimonadaceae bacterium]|nr:thermonuclease family protein [Gloeobacterales cyanobacterium ES-bin-141]